MKSILQDKKESYISGQTYGVHGMFGHELDLKLKQECQKEYEKNHTRESFIKLIGKSYL